jgi:hypothetical protein
MRRKVIKLLKIDIQTKLKVLETKRNDEQFKLKLKRDDEEFKLKLNEAADVRRVLFTLGIIFSFVALLIGSIKQQN